MEKENISGREKIQGYELERGPKICFLKLYHEKTRSCFKAEREREKDGECVYFNQLARIPNNQLFLLYLALVRHPRNQSKHDDIVFALITFTTGWLISFFVDELQIETITKIDQDSQNNNFPGRSRLCFESSGKIMFGCWNSAYDEKQKQK